jgi:hypothetical protein
MDWLVDSAPKDPSATLVAMSKEDTRLLYEAWYLFEILKQ